MAQAAAHVIVALLIVLGWWEGGAFTQSLWPKRLLSLRAILGGGKNWGIPGLLAAKVAHGASIHPEFAPGDPHHPRAILQWTAVEVHKDRHIYLYATTWHTRLRCTRED